MKIFISGPMKGYEDFNTPAFNAAEAELIANGWSVFNPAWIKVDSTWDRNNLLPIDIAALAQCDAIYMLAGWEQSAGARAEYEFAVSCGKTVIYQSTILVKENDSIATAVADSGNSFVVNTNHTTAITNQSYTETSGVLGDIAVAVHNHDTSQTGSIPKLVKVNKRGDETNASVK